ncbi:peptidyl-glycine alpha-amidating monooxygenase B-like [Asterias amurensis]|uniref:peptidyl-glycine alpha-amidating monooxygenase B-like n=1 Tax=Asterias amurensis TaxID=7602 RepID=UPI003AB23EB1
MDSCSLARLLLDLFFLLAVLGICCGQYDTWRRDMMRRHGDDDGDESEPDENFFYIDAFMPGVIIDKSDQYVCTSVLVPRQDSYIVGFEPHASMNTAHHMLLYGCSDIQAQPGQFYDCGHMGTCRGNGKILFAWARNASQPLIPSGVGFHVGGSSGLKYFTLQIHYGEWSHLKGMAPDHSGVSMYMTYMPQPYAGGVYLLGASSMSIPPGVTNYHADVACAYRDPIPIYPFAFRTHAHELSTVISGYRIRQGEWALLGKGNPQWPQAFYPMEQTFEIRQGDYLAARCTYNSLTRHTATHAGATANDEMCNFYMMYYTDAINGESYKMCWDGGSQQIFRNIPFGSDTIPLHPPSLHRQEVPEGGVPYDHVPQESYGYNNNEESNYNPNWNADDPNEDTYKNFLDKWSRITQPYFTQGENEEKVDGADEMVEDVGMEVNTVKPEMGQTAVGAEWSTERTKTEQGATDEGKDDLRKMEGWPITQGITLGQVAGVAVDSTGDVHIFHRVETVWGAGSFSVDNHYLHSEQGAIKNNTVLVIDKETGLVKQQWGANMFFMPHGLSIDHESNVWLTDVALHQAFKFPAGGSGEPLLTLGTEFQPGSGTDHFCKPTDVAVDPASGNIYVADGYCNSRIVMFSPTGDYIKEWGKASSYIGRELAINPAPSTFSVPHSLSFIPDRRQICVADRENGRIQCFQADTGEFKKEYKLKEFGAQVFAINYSPWKGGVLYAINGRGAIRGSTSNPVVQGFTIDFDTGKLLQTWKPASMEFGRPHDVVASTDFRNVYVVEIGPNKVWKFERTLGPEPTTSNLLENGHSSQSLKQNFSEHIPNAATDASLTTTAIIVAVLAVPIFLMLLVAIAVRLRAQGRMKFFKGGDSGTAIRSGYRATDKFSFGNFFNRRKGFNQVSTEDSDHDGGMGWSDDSDVEEYSIMNSKRTQNL